MSKNNFDIEGFFDSSDQYHSGEFDLTQNEQYQKVSEIINKNIEIGLDYEVFFKKNKIEIYFNEGYDSIKQEIIKEEIEDYFTKIKKPLKVSIIYKFS